VNPDARQSHLKSAEWPGASGLAEDVRYYGEWMKQEAFKRIGHLYPKVKVPKEQGGGEATVIAWIWARTVKCPNPACGCEMPLVRSFELSKKKGKEAYVEPVISGGQISYVVKKGDGAPEGTVTRIGAHCICCGTPVSFDYVRSEAKNNRMSAQLIAIVAEGQKKRIYLSPSVEQERTAICEEPADCPQSNLPEKALGFRVQAYGMTKHKDLFTPRQLTALTTFSDLVHEAQKKAETDAVAAGMGSDDTSLADGGTGAAAYGQAVGVYLGFAVDKGANLWSSLCSWMNDRGAFRETFARQAIPMIWDYAEANPFSDSGGNLSMFIERCADTVDYLPAVLQIGNSKQFEAQNDNGLRNIMVSTDPPYYDNIGYADLSDFFYVWLRQSLKGIYPKLFGTMLVPKKEELVATPYRFDGSKEKARDFFEDGMSKAFQQIYIYAREDVPMTIYYAFKQSESEEDTDQDTKTASTGWETMLSAIISANFTITGTWPMRTESPGRALAQDTNALASSIVLVCRKRAAEAPSCTRRNFINALKRELKPALTTLQASNIAPVDLAQAAIGPGMGVYSRFSKVLEADGAPMGVRAALALINQELDLYFAEQDGELDRDSRFCVDLYTQYAFNNVKFGEADVLARAKNTSVERLAGQGAIYAQKGVVRLLTREEIKENIDPQKDFTWLLTQQLTRALEKDGVTGAAKIVADIFTSEPERAKALAYRLFTIAERKRWTQEALAYNSLVIAWPEVQSKATELMSRGVNGEQLRLFSEEEE
jgi:putative DNA methylase